MPDWSYQTIFRPLLFLMPPERARSITLKSIGTLAKIPGGPSIIEWMGHMNPPSQLSKTMGPVTFPTSVGLGAGLDTECIAIQALSKFGFGFLELGPVSKDPIVSHGTVQRDITAMNIHYSGYLVNNGIDDLLRRLTGSSGIKIPIGVRLACQPETSLREATEELQELIGKLEHICSFFTIDTRANLGQPEWSHTAWKEHFSCLRSQTDLPLLLAIPPSLSETEVLPILTSAKETGLNGLVVAGGIIQEDSSCANTFVYTAGRSSHKQAVKFVSWTREQWPDALIIGSGGILEPQDALTFLAAGADFVQLHSGLVYSGPGLPKRINEAILQSQPATNPPQEKRPAFLFPSWVWGILLGLGMMIGGALAWLVAATTVVLPYDERFLGMSADQLAFLNAQILSFMSHDRVSLAGTMISIGILYSQLAYHGLRKELHWTKTILLVSGAVGFSSIFLFIGYGYFDYLHAILALVLFPMFLLALRTPAKVHLTRLPPQLHNDRDWRMALWGQLLFVIIGFGLTGAGIIISIIGVTGVFVPSDLVFLCVSADTLQSYNERLIPVIAHDRAGFGGALVSNGLAVLLISLWGIRRGEGWIWWTLFLAGIPGFVSGISIHFTVGYVDFIHLLPAYVAVLLFLIALVLLKPYLCRT
ncbi:dihydroorotate dehydrogenase [Brevibacillus brevis]|uniref:dihydroorotate dehydrogenase n=1 Tax=Brevibacillus brevis TaxID=1393 RepID=UPI001157745E|nr:dihydroorotate dehydrogenase [Lysinibacillus sp. SDF0063]TQR36165.1 dihydroorotate dehydrogenase [Lysinibacillus sp. SDF0063]